LFANREVGALCIHHGGRLIHYSGFTPRYWRFAFLTDRDLQIGDTWTDPEHRGKGLAGYALQEIIDIKQTQGRRFWHVVGDANRASIRVVEKAGFGLVGKGSWNKPSGIKLLGSYVLLTSDAEPPNVLSPTQDVAPTEVSISASAIGQIHSRRAKRGIVGTILSEYELSNK